MKKRTNILFDYLCRLKLTILKKTFPLLIIFFSLSLGSCIPLEHMMYIRPDENLKLNEYGMIEENRPTYYLQKDDLINISISAKQGVDLGIFSSYLVGGQEVLNQSGNDRRGLRIEEDGCIELPRIGRIYLEGLTMEEAQSKIEDAFYEIYQPDAAYIEVTRPALYYTVIGESGTGNFVARRYNYNLLEALASSGSLGLYADRKRIQILRTTPEGTQRAEVDITKESIMNSEYFWLQPNDIIIINPRRQKQWGFGLSPIAAIGTVLGGIATIIGIYYFFKNL